MSISEAMGRRVPFAEHLGIRVTQRGHGTARLELELKPEHLNSWNVAHGGVVMTLADVALAIAARTLDESARGAITVTFNASFIGKGEGRLVAEARCLRAGGALAFSEAEIRDGAGALVAKAGGTFKLRRDPAPGSEG